MPAPSSPCTKVCLIDPASGLCEGCGRTVGEIASWSRMSEGERLAVMATLPDRIAATASGRPGQARRQHGASP